MSNTENATADSRADDTESSDGALTDEELEAVQGGENPFPSPPDPNSSARAQALGDGSIW